MYCQIPEWLQLKASPARIKLSLGALVFLISINGLAINIVSTVKRLMDDEILFSIVHDTINKNLQKNWTSICLENFIYPRFEQTDWKKLYFLGR